MPKSYEDEIREILDHMDQFLPDDRQSAKRRRQRSRTSKPQLDTGRQWRRFTGQFPREALTPYKLMGGAMLLILFAWVMGYFNPPLGQLLSLTAIILFIVGLVWSIRSGGTFRRTSSSSQWWRGQVIELPRRSWWDSVRAWWRRLTGPRRRPPRDSWQW